MLLNRYKGLMHCVHWTVADAAWNVHWAQLVGHWRQVFSVVVLTLIRPVGQVVMHLPK